MAQGARLGLQLGIGAFVVGLLMQVVPILTFAFLLLSVACASVLQRDVQRRHPDKKVLARVGLLLMIVGALALTAAPYLLVQACPEVAQGTFCVVPSAVAAQFGGLIAMAIAFYLLAQPLVGARSEFFLGIALGTAFVVFGGGAWVIVSGSNLREAAALAQGMPFVLFAWAYAAVLGRLRRDAAAPGEPVV
jgi:hypothetical protein